MQTERNEQSSNLYRSVGLTEKKNITMLLRSLTKVSHFLEKLCVHSHVYLGAT